MTRDEIWAEAQRLHEPLRYLEDLGVGSITAAELAEWEDGRWVAALSLACFADWDAKQLRATGKQHCIEGDDVRQPCGYMLLFVAAMLCDKAPSERLRLVSRG